MIAPLQGFKCSPPRARTLRKNFFMDGSFFPERRLVPGAEPRCQIYLELRFSRIFSSRHMYSVLLHEATGISSLQISQVSLFSTGGQIRMIGECLSPEAAGPAEHVAFICESRHLQSF